MAGNFKYNPNKHHRRSIRLKGYDYSSAGLYFITICCQHRTCRFGYIKDGVMYLNAAGEMAGDQWLALTGRFKNIVLHEYVVMPNHFHAIIEIVGTPHVGDDDKQGEGIGAPLVSGPLGQPQGIAPTPAPTTLGDIIGAYHSIVTVEYIKGVKNLGWPPFRKKLLQRNFYEHIIRNEQAYERISNYIINNPKNWKGDTFFE